MSSWSQQLNEGYWAAIAQGQVPLSLNTTVQCSSSFSDVEALLGPCELHWEDEDVSSGFSGADYSDLGLSFIFHHGALYIVRFHGSARRTSHGTTSVPQGNAQQEVLLPLGFTWSMRLNDVRAFFSSYALFDHAFPLCSVQQRGGGGFVSLMWPGFSFEFNNEHELTMMDMVCGVLSEPCIGAYRDICHQRHVEGDSWLRGALHPLQPMVEPGGDEEEEDEEEDAAGADMEADDVQERIPIYMHAVSVLKAHNGGPMHYTDIAAALQSRGTHFTPESVVGSLSGYVNSSRGKPHGLIVRSGKGEYELRSNHEPPPGEGEQDVDDDDEREAQRVAQEASGATPLGGQRAEQSVAQAPLSGVKRARDASDDEYEEEGDEEEVAPRGAPAAADGDWEEDEDEDEEELEKEPKKVKTVSKPTFLHVFTALKGHKDRLTGVSSVDLARICSAAGHVITAQRLISRMSAYASYRRKKKLPDLFDKDGSSIFLLSEYGRGIAEDPEKEAEFLASLEKK